MLSFSDGIIVIYICPHYLHLPSGLKVFLPPEKSMYLLGLSISVFEYTACHWLYDKERQFWVIFVAYSLPL
jgi:hypothetical protein